MLTGMDQPPPPPPGIAGRCQDCAIRERAVCAHCDTGELARLESIKFYRSFQAGQPILWEGDRLDYVASVVTGTVALTRSMADGRRQMTGLLLPSDFLGRPGRAVAACDATAATDVTLCCFRRRPFEALMAETPHLSQRLLEMTLDELDAAREWMLLLGRKTARERIASFIAMIARRGGTAGRVLELPLSREAMADHLGLTIETVSRQIGALRRDGVIELAGTRGVVLCDPARLARECGDDGLHNAGRP